MVENSGTNLAGALKAVTKTKLHEQIADQIRELIDNGHLKHGDRLPPERELATIFKVSRHSVREAIRTLEQKNTLKSKPGSGTYVALEDESSVVEFLSRAINKEKHTLAEIFQFRELLETQIAGLAAQKAGLADLAVLQDILQRQNHALDDSNRFKTLDEEFHLALARATGNSVLLQVIGLLDHLFKQSRQANYRSARRNRLSIKGHRKIITAVKDGDAEAARAFMADHLHSIRNLVISADDHSAE